MFKLNEVANFSGYITTIDEVLYLSLQNHYLTLAELRTTPHKLLIADQRIEKALLGGQLAYYGGGYSAFFHYSELQGVIVNNDPPTIQVTSMKIRDQGQPFKTIDLSEENLQAKADRYKSDPEIEAIAKELWSDLYNAN